MGDQIALPANADDTYEIVIRSAADGGGTIKRGPIKIKPLDLIRTSGTPPLRRAVVGGIQLPPEAYTFYPGGFDATWTSAQWDDGVASDVHSDSQFMPAGGFSLEIQAGPDEAINGMFPAFMGIAPVSDLGNFVAGWTKAESINPDVIVPLGANPVNYFYIKVPGDKFTMIVQPDGTVTYYINYNGATTQPWFISPQHLDMTVPYKLVFVTQGGFETGIGASAFRTQVRNVRWLRGNTPEFIYTGDMQKLDNAGSLPSNVFVGVRKLSVHPLGPPSDWLYQTFTRP